MADGRARPPVGVVMAGMAGRLAAASWLTRWWTASPKAPCAMSRWPHVRWDDSRATDDRGSQLYRQKREDDTSHEATEHRDSVDPHGLAPISGARFRIFDRDL